MLVRREILHLHILHFFVLHFNKEGAVFVAFFFCNHQIEHTVIWMHIEYCPLFPILESFSVYRYL